MTTSPPIAAPSTAESAAPSTGVSSSSSSSNNNNNNFGPVTKLAHQAAAQHQSALLEQRKLESERIKAMAAVVGETASVIAAANAHGSPVRLSPRQKQSMTIIPSPNKKKMSVAARARMQADLPTMPPSSNNNNRQQQQAELSQRRNSNTNDNNKNTRRATVPQQQRAPSSGNAGVSRGRFSKAQVKQLLDEWGREDTSEEDCYDDDSYGEEDYYYDVPREEQFHLRASQKQQQQNNSNEQQFKSPLERSHLQYTMSQSPDRSPVMRDGAEDSNVNDADKFQYQHHRVSSYNTARQNNIGGGGADPYGDSYYEQGGGQHHGSYEEGESSSGGGLFSTAKNWLQHQRDRLHQLELERQVEDQRRKLVEEGRKQRFLESERRLQQQQQQQQNMMNQNANNNQQQNQQGGIATSNSFGCIEGQLGRTTPNTNSPNKQHEQQQADYVESEETLCNIPEQSVIVSGVVPNLCGFGGYANQLDDSTDYSGVARVDSQGNIIEMIPSDSMDDDDDDDNDGIGESNGHHSQHKVCMKVSSPKATLSGEGMSVNVDIPDLNIDDDNRNGSHAKNRMTNSQSLHNVEGEVKPQDNDNAYEGEGDDDPYFISDIKIVPEPPQDEMSYSKPILEQLQMKALIASGGLPPSLNFCKWKRIYSLTRDGDSFDQFLRLVEGHDRTVLVVRTTRDELFGGYADTRWEGRHRRQQAHDFYGSAQACLFRFPNYNNNHDTTPPSMGTRKKKEEIIMYKWSGANRYIQLCDVAKRTVAFGGGGDEGDFGLCIEDDFRRGTTGHCSTFENEPLCDEGYFDVMDLEVWGFTLDF